MAYSSRNFLNLYINLLRSPCAYPRSKTAGYYGAEKQNRRATPKVKIALSTRQERGEYKFKSLSPQQNGWLRRRQAIEPAIGHLKSDNRLDRCWLQGALGDKCIPSAALLATTCAGCCAPLPVSA